VRIDRALSDYRRETKFDWLRFRFGRWTTDRRPLLELERSRLASHGSGACAHVDGAAQFGRAAKILAYDPGRSGRPRGDDRSLCGPTTQQITGRDSLARALGTHSAEPVLLRSQSLSTGEFARSGVEATRRACGQFHLVDPPGGGGSGHSPSRPWTPSARPARAKTADPSARGVGLAPYHGPYHLAGGFRWYSWTLSDALDARGAPPCLYRTDFGSVGRGFESLRAGQLI
jgi:hypothetical protein